MDEISTCDNSSGLSVETLKKTLNVVYSRLFQKLKQNLSGGNVALVLSPKAMPSGSPFLRFTWSGFSSIMWHPGAATTAMESAVEFGISRTVMLGGGVMECLRGGVPIVGGGLSGDMGTSGLLVRVGECWAGGVPSRVAKWLWEEGCGAGVTWRRGWGWEWGACLEPSSSSSFAVDGECGDTCNKATTINELNISYHMSPHWFYFIYDNSDQVIARSLPNFDFPFEKKISAKCFANLILNHCFRSFCN